MKKIYAILLVVCMLMTMTSFPAFAADAVAITGALGNTNNYGAAKTVDKAYDGDLTTRFLPNQYKNPTANGTYEVIFELESTVTLDTLTINWGAATWGETGPDKYNVYVSADNAEYEQILTYEGLYTKDTAPANYPGLTYVSGNEGGVNITYDMVETGLNKANVKYIKIECKRWVGRPAIREISVTKVTDVTEPDGPDLGDNLVVNGAQIRIPDGETEAGLRFGATIKKSFLGIGGEYVYDANAEKSFGMFLLPKDMLGTHATLARYLTANNYAGDALKVPAVKVYSQNDTAVTYTAVLTDIPTEDYGRDIVAVPYVYAEGTYTFAGEETRSYESVAVAARETTYSDAEIAKITDPDLKERMQSISDKLDEIIKTAAEESGVRKLPFSKGININRMETFLSENPYGFFEQGIRTLTDENTYTNIKAQGFDHVRLPINFYTIYYEASSYNYTTEQLMGHVDTAIDLATKHGLYVILDFHGWFYIGEEENDYDEFLYCWSQVAERYKDYSEMLAFELLNEPWYTDGSPQKYLSDSKLNKMQAEAIKIIRDTGSNNKDRLIICCTADGNKAWKLSVLTLPDDDNLAVAIHEYSPYNFTHQNFSWAGLGGKKTTLEAEGGFAKATNYDFSEIVKFMEKTGIPVVLNEFGVNLDKATDEDTDTYLRGIATFCKTNDIPWAYWQYDDGYSAEGAMALYRKTSYFGSQAWDTDALDALFLR